MSSEKFEINPELNAVMQDLFNFQEISGKMKKAEAILEELNDALSELPEGHHAYEIADEISDAANQVVEMSARMMAGWWFSINGYGLDREG